MTIYPGMLEHLYNNGIIPYVPYDLCQITPVSPIGMNQSGLMPLGNLKQMVLGDTNNNISNYNNNSNYLDTAMKGQMYGYYGNSNDSFAGSNYRQNGTNQQTMQMYGGGYGGGIGNYPNAGSSYSAGNYGVGSYGNSYPMNTYGGGMGNYPSAGYPYAANGYGANSYGNPYSNNGYGANSYGNPYSNNGYGANPYGNGSNGMTPGIYNRYDRRLQNGNGNGFRDLINSQAKGSKNGVLNSDPLLKGLLATSIIIATPLLIFKGFKKSATKSTKTGFLSKLRPKNIFKGSGKSKFDWSKLRPRNWFGGWGKSKIDWSKLNPKNWFGGTSKIDWAKLSPKNWFKKTP